ncbi:MULTISPECIES: pyridoxamine 5'-phosphate oxidase family protein [Aminobacter]|uniref:Flavin-nucleotide-binding protein n=2 Tax=Aminobacter aminovorans TaxID=83263 RepID=A0AAC8YSW5_AMIAI|nr:MULTISPECIES: pyridoxamine 5'-phosphate oxidase family protein [Aminobacter]AMS43912.1 Flavin-nucleotide-binding protein [Aminobacter aminovorans]MRX36701.1 pyridoxamine 5'-phosphate oxidase family protein [Aminobacter sp. MDW-2]
MNPNRTVPVTQRTRVRRFHKRGFYDRETILTILDAGFLCHVGFLHDGQPFVLPTLYWHDSENLYFHGSTASRMVKAAAAQTICVNITHLDALVLTRSAFHHSANYRSATIIGKGRLISDPEVCAMQLRLMMERLFPRRWDTLRPVTSKELKATRIIAVSLAEASAKIRVGSPDEDSNDLTWPAWGGIVPIRSVVGLPVPDTITENQRIDELPCCAVQP